MYAYACIFTPLTAPRRCIFVDAEAVFPLATNKQAKKGGHQEEHTHIPPRQRSSTGSGAAESSVTSTSPATAPPR